MRFWKFQSTHPMRGATYGCKGIQFDNRNFNPRTPCGVRRHYTRIIKMRKAYFNPRTPCGVRPAAVQPSGKRSRFQSTHPMRGATQLADAAGIDIRFQSTHPMRGATNKRIKLLETDAISIHAPHAGCDANDKIGNYQAADFNPRTPCGVRQQNTTKPSCSTA